MLIVHKSINKGVTMLVELRDVEVHVEPEEILTQALQEGDVTVSTAVSLCIDEEGIERVLDAIENDDIRTYCDNNSIYDYLEDFESIAAAVKELTQPEKAQLVWMLLKCEG